MEAGKIDRRRRYTLSVIREAFFALLAEVGFVEDDGSGYLPPRRYQPVARSICTTRTSSPCSTRLSTRPWRRCRRSRERRRVPSASVRRQTMTIICSTRMTTRTPGWHSASSSAAPSRWFPRSWRRLAFARGRLSALRPQRPGKSRGQPPARLEARARVCSRSGAAQRLFRRGHAGGIGSSRSS